LDIGSEEICKLKAKDRYLHQRLAVLKTLNILNCLPAKNFQEQLLAVCPEVGVSVPTESRREDRNTSYQRAEVHQVVIELMRILV